MSLMEQLQQTVSFIQSKIQSQAKVGIVLGSGLGNLAEVIKVEQAISYTDIPNFPTSTVKGHGGKLLFGELGGTKVVVMSGRFDFYEGY
jgi:purine-nucleoside phosphorylase